MRRAHLALLLLLLPAAVLCGHQGVHRGGHPSGHKAGHEDYEEEDDDDHEHEHKDVSESNGHSLVIDLSSLSVLAALKIKFVVVTLIVIAVFLLITKSYKITCLFGNCRPNYSTYGYYPYVDYNYVGYEVPSASYVAAPYRRPGASHPKDSAHFSDLTARVWNSIDLAGMAFSALNVHEDDCRRKLVCQADRAAATNPLLRAALSWFSASLARYRTDRSREEAGPGDGAETRQADPCEDMYPRCLHRDLPAALGGPVGGPGGGHAGHVGPRPPAYTYLGPAQYHPEAHLQSLHHLEAPQHSLHHLEVPQHSLHHQEVPQHSLHHQEVPQHSLHYEEVPHLSLHHLEVPQHSLHLLQHQLHLPKDHIASAVVQVSAEPGGDVPAGESWLRPQLDFRPEYVYEFPSEQHGAPSTASPADVLVTAPSRVRDPEAVDGDTLLDGTASTNSVAAVSTTGTVTVLAPVQDGASGTRDDPVPRPASTATPSAISTATDTVPGKSGAPSDRPDPEPRSPASGSPSPATSMAPPTVWRPFRLGNSTREPSLRRRN